MYQHLAMTSYNNYTGPEHKPILVTICMCGTNAKFYIWGDLLHVGSHRQGLPQLNSTMPLWQMSGQCWTLSAWSDDQQYREDKAAVLLAMERTGLVHMITPTLGFTVCMCAHTVCACVVLLNAAPSMQSSSNQASSARTSWNSYRDFNNRIKQHSPQKKTCTGILITSMIYDLLKHFCSSKQSWLL